LGWNLQGDIKRKENDRFLYTARKAKQAIFAQKTLKNLFSRIYALTYKPTLFQPMASSSPLFMISAPTSRMEQ